MPEISDLIFASGHHLFLTCVLACISAGALAYAASLVVPAQYLASSFVKVGQREGFLLTNRQSRADDIAFVRAQVANVVQTRTLDRALEEPSLQFAMQGISTEDRVEWLRSQIKAEIPAGSELLTITAAHASPELALQISRAVSKAYVEVTIDQLQSGRTKRIAELELATREADNQLKNLWKSLQDKAEKFGSANPQSLSLTEQMKLQDYRENAQRMRTLQLQRSQLEIQIGELQSKRPASEAISDEQVQEMVGQIPDVIARTEQLRQLDNKIQEIQRLTSNDKLPRLMKMRGDRQQSAAELDQIKSTQERRVRAKLVSTEATPASTEISALEKQRSLIEEEESFLQQTLSNLETVIEQSGGPSGVELEIIRHEITREKELADNLWKTLQELRIEEQAEQRVALIKVPEVADKLSRSKQLKAVSASIFGGILLAVLGVGYREWSSCRIRYPEAITQKTGLNVFGSVSGRNEFARSSRGAHEAASLLMMKKRSDGTLPNVLVTSAEDAEPRALVSDELATVLAENGFRVLLVNCDSNDRSLEQLWKTAKRLQSQGNDWKSDIRTSEQSDVHYLPLSVDESSSSWIGSQGLDPILEHATNDYDCVVVQGPPILTTAESLLIASKFELCLLAFSMGKSRWNLLAAACSRLALCGTGILGAVAHDGSRLRPTKRKRMARSTMPSIEESDSLPMGDEQLLSDQVNALQDDLKSHQTHLQLRAPTKPRSNRHQRTSVDHRNSE